MSLPAGSRESADLFNSTAVHEEAGLHRTESEQIRIRETVAMIPPGTGSLLDVGCGRGDLLHAIDVPFSVGTDLARRGIRFVRRPAAVSSMLALPFPDRSFDVVLCAETLEHLDPADLTRAAAELRRVARKRLLVTVPYQEDLLAWSTRCSALRYGVSPLRAPNVFSPERLTSTLPGGEHTTRCAESGRFAQCLAGAAALSHRDARSLEVLAVVRCPQCGNEAFDNQERRLAYTGVVRSIRCCTPQVGSIAGYSAGGSVGRA